MSVDTAPVWKKYVLDGEENIVWAYKVPNEFYVLADDGVDFFRPTGYVVFTGTAFYGMDRGGFEDIAKEVPGDG